MVDVVVASGHSRTRAGLVGALAGEKRVRVIGEAGTAGEAVELLGDAHVAVLDLLLPGGGIMASRKIRARRPGAGVVIVSSYPDEQGMVAAFDAGARGFLCGGGRPELLGDAVRYVAGGGSFVDPSIAARLVALASRGIAPRGPHGLTRQELRVLSYLPQALTNRQIADRLGLSEQTIKSHMRAVLQKLGVGRRADAALRATREGLV